MRGLVATIYLVTALFLVQLGLSCHNVWAFLIRQKKYKTTPLLVFYILTIMITISHIWYTLFVLRAVTLNNIFDEFAPFLKINLGLVQCWIFFELSLHIHKSIKIDREIL